MFTLLSYSCSSTSLLGSSICLVYFFVSFVVVVAVVSPCVVTTWQLFQPVVLVLLVVGLCRNHFICINSKDCRILSNSLHLVS